MPSRPGRADVSTLAREPRLAEIERLLLDTKEPKQPFEIIQLVMAKFSIRQRQAYKDLAEVQHRIAQANAKTREQLVAEADLAWQKRELIADRRGDSAAANQALDRRCKLHGLYAPKKIEHSGVIGVTTTLDIRLDAIIAVLDPAGLAALDVVLEQIERARAAGVLKDPVADQDEGDDGAEVLALPAATPEPRSDPG